MHPAGAEGEHGHSHVDLGTAARLRSIGIDVGSATTQFALSELYVGKHDPFLVGKPQVLHRHLLYESPILLTPFVGRNIDATAIERFLEQECRRAGFELGEIDTGALICTGEAARKDNAKAISQQLAAAGGKFVCATAGHFLEAVLGAHGSGAVDLSRGYDGFLVTLDVGGGTAKRTLIQDGHIVHAAALNVGARLIAFDGNGRVTRVEEAGREIARAAGIDVELGLALSEEQVARIVERMARSLAQFLELEPADDLTERLILTEVPALPRRFDLIVAGGLAEYFYGREQRPMGDLGQALSSALERELGRCYDRGRVLTFTRGIRSTVIGAGQFAVQVSGDTVFLEGRLHPPLRNVPVRAVQLDWSQLNKDHVAAAVDLALADRPPEELTALSFGQPHVHGYGSARKLASTLGSVLARLQLAAGVILVFEHNVARTIGEALAHDGAPTPFLCVDELDVNDLDYLDVGEPVPGEAYLPVIVKTLVFS